MIELIDDLPPDTVGVRLVGKIEVADYENVLVPALEAAQAAHDPVNVLAVLGPEFESYSAGALWEDSTWGMRHLKGWGRIALVSDRDWVRHIVSVGRVLIPARLKMFTVAQLEDAKAWVVAEDA